MTKKIKITESQRNRLFTEAEAPKTNFQGLELGDSIYVTDAAGKHSFQVIDDLGNALKLGSLDQKSTKTGWEYILSRNEDFSNGNIKLIQISKKNPDTKRSYTINGVTDVKTYDRDNTEKSNVNLNKPKNTTNNSPSNDVDTEEDIQKLLEETLIELRGLEPSRLYIFEVDETTQILFKVVSNDGDELVMKLVTATGDDKDTYLNNKNVTFSVELKIDNIRKSPLGLGWFDLLLKDNSGGENILKNISDFIPYNKDIKPDDNEDPEGGNSEGLDVTSKDNMKDLLSRYPHLKSALYKQPKLMGLFNVGNPVGLAAVGGLIKNYAAKEASYDFTENKKVDFEIVSSRIFINVGSKPYVLDKGQQLQLVATKVGETVVLTTSKTAKSKLDVEILEKLPDGNYNAKFIGISVKPDGRLTKVEKNGTIKVLSYG